MDIKAKEEYFYKDYKVEILDYDRTSQVRVYRPDNTLIHINNNCTINVTEIINNDITFHENKCPQCNRKFEKEESWILKYLRTYFG